MAQQLFGTNLIPSAACQTPDCSCSIAIVALREGRHITVPETPMVNCIRCGHGYLAHFAQHDAVPNVAAPAAMRGPISRGSASLPLAAYRSSLPTHQYSPLLPTSVGHTAANFSRQTAMERHRPSPTIPVLDPAAEPYGFGSSSFAAPPSRPRKAPSRRARAAHASPSDGGLFLNLKKKVVVFMIPIPLVGLPCTPDYISNAVSDWTNVSAAYVGSMAARLRPVGLIFTIEVPTEGPVHEAVIEQVMVQLAAHEHQLATAPLPGTAVMDPNATDPIENAPFIYLGITARSKSGIMYRLKPLPVSSVALDYRALIGLAKTSGKKPCPLGYPTHRMDSLEGEMLFLCARYDIIRRREGHACDTFRLLADIPNMDCFAGLRTACITGQCPLERSTGRTPSPGSPASQPTSRAARRRMASPMWDREHEYAPTSVWPSVSERIHISPLSDDDDVPMPSTISELIADSRRTRASIDECLAHAGAMWRPSSPPARQAAPSGDHGLPLGNPLNLNTIPSSTPNAVSTTSRGLMASQSIYRQALGQAASVGTPEHLVAAWRGDLGLSPLPSTVARDLLPIWRADTGLASPPSPSVPPSDTLGHTRSFRSAVLSNQLGTSTPASVSSPRLAITSPRATEERPTRAALISALPECMRPVQPGGLGRWASDIRMNHASPGQRLVMRGPSAVAVARVLLSVIAHDTPGSSSPLLTFPDTDVPQADIRTLVAADWVYKIGDMAFGEGCKVAIMYELSRIAVEDSALWHHDENKTYPVPKFHIEQDMAPSVSLLATWRTFGRVTAFLLVAGKFPPKASPFVILWALYGDSALQLPEEYLTLLDESSRTSLNAFWSLRPEDRLDGWVVKGIMSHYLNAPDVGPFHSRTVETHHSLRQRLPGAYVLDGVQRGAPQQLEAFKTGLRDVLIGIDAHSVSMASVLGALCSRAVHSFSELIPQLVFRAVGSVSKESNGDSQDEMDQLCFEINVREYLQEAGHPEGSKLATPQAREMAKKDFTLRLRMFLKAVTSSEYLPIDPAKKITFNIGLAGPGAANLRAEAMAISFHTCFNTADVSLTERFRRKFLSGTSDEQGFKVWLHDTLIVAGGGFNQT